MLVSGLRLVELTEPTPRRYTGFKRVTSLYFNQHQISSIQYLAACGTVFNFNYFFIFGSGSAGLGKQLLMLYKENTVFTLLI
jgi:hypothetical protein